MLGGNQQDERLPVERYFDDRLGARGQRQHDGTQRSLGELIE
jgi:hypothetical protein